MLTDIFLLTGSVEVLTKQRKILYFPKRASDPSSEAAGKPSKAKEEIVVSHRV